MNYENETQSDEAKTLRFSLNLFLKSPVFRDSARQKTGMLVNKYVMLDKTVVAYRVSFNIRDEKYHEVSLVIPNLIRGVFTMKDLKKYLKDQLEDKIKILSR
jgi:hypothetical protein